MSKKKVKGKKEVALPVSGLTATELAKKMATVAPAGQRLGGPGTRSKNPKRYDNYKPNVEA